MRNYEAMYILDTRGKDDSAEEIITRIETAIQTEGGALKGKPQKIGRQKFERAPGRQDSGFYVNIRFTAEPPVIAKLREKFALDTQVFRQVYLESRPTKSAA